MTGPGVHGRPLVARIGDGGDLLKCSFCGKSQKQVKKLIAGPGVYICDECIDLCNEIIEEELAESGDLSHVPGEVAVTAHRIAGEALTNAARHARAGRIRVALSGHPDHLVVEVADDGTGAVQPRPGGVGLEAMRQRAESVGGVLTVTAVPDRGTRVRAVLPLQVAT